MVRRPLPCRVGGDAALYVGQGEEGVAEAKGGTAAVRYAAFRHAAGVRHTRYAAGETGFDRPVLFAVCGSRTSQIGVAPGGVRCEAVQSESSKGWSEQRDGEIK
jgi:hypothetical protein